MLLLSLSSTGNARRGAAGQDGRWERRRGRRAAGKEVRARQGDASGKPGNYQAGRLPKNIILYLSYYSCQIKNSSRTHSKFSKYLILWYVRAKRPDILSKESILGPPNVP